jgi:hypothetical protein
MLVVDSKYCGHRPLPPELLQRILLMSKLQADLPEHMVNIGLQRCTSAP